MSASGDPPAEADAPLSSWLRGDFLLVCAATLAVFIGHLLFLPTLPTFIKRLGGQESDIGLMFAVTAATSLVLRPFIGQLIDVIGSRRMVILGAALFLASALAYNLADTEPKLLLVRVITGGGFAVFLTATSVLVAQLVPATRRGEAIGYYAMSNNLAFAISPFLGVAIMESTALRDLDNSFTDRISWLAGSEGEPENFTLVFLTAAVFSAIGLVLVLFLRERGSERPAGERFAWSRHRIVSRPALFPAAVNFCQMMSMAAVFAFIVLLARDRGIEARSYFFLAFALAVTLVRLFSGRLSDRYGRGSVIIPGLALTAIAMLVLGVAESSVVLLLGAVIFGLGNGVTMPALMALTIDRAPADSRGVAISTFTLSADLGMSIGAPVLGLLLSWTDYTTTYFFAAAGVVVGLVVYLAGSRTRPAVDVAPMADAPAGAERFADR